MAQKIKIDLDLQEIQDLVHGQLAAVGVQASAASASQLSALYRGAVQRLQTPLSDTPRQYGFQIRQQQLEREIRERQERESRNQEKQQAAQQHPFFHALGGFHLGAGFGGGGLGGVVGSVRQFAKLLETADPALVGVTGGLALLAVAAFKASETLTAMAQGALATGSTPGGFGFAQALGGVAGLSPEGTTGMLQGLRNRIATEPLAMAAAGQFGVRAFQPGYGPIPNMGKMFETLFTAMQHMSTPEMQQFGERIPEMQPFEALAKYGRPDQIARIHELTSAIAELGSRENIQAAISLTTAQGELRLQWHLLATTLGTVVLPAVTNIVKGLSVLLDFSPEKNAFAAFASGHIKEGFKDLAGLKDEKGDKDKRDGAMKEHTDAMKGHAEELRLTRNGVFGGGSRAQGAIPPGLRGIALQRALDANAVRLGAF